MGNVVWGIINLFVSVVLCILAFTSDNSGPPAVVFFLTLILSAISIAFFVNAKAANTQRGSLKSKKTCIILNIVSSLLLLLFILMAF